MGEILMLICTRALSCCPRSESDGACVFSLFTRTSHCVHHFSLWQRCTHGVHSWFYMRLWGLSFSFCIPRRVGFARPITFLPLAPSRKEYIVRVLCEWVRTYIFWHRHIPLWCNLASPFFIRWIQLCMQMREPYSLHLGGIVFATKLC